MEAVIDISIFIILGLFTYIVIDLISDLISLFKKKVWVSNVRNSQLVRETIIYTNDILYQKGIRHFPNFKISYYKHKRFLGVYNDSKIIIYVKNATNAVDIVGITLHEVNHYIQHKTNMKEYANYEYYSEIYGYINNPLEKECRKFEEDWLQPCLQSLKSKNIIRLE